MGEGRGLFVQHETPEEEGRQGWSRLPRHAGEPPGGPLCCSLRTEALQTGSGEGGRGASAPEVRQVHCAARKTEGPGQAWKGRRSARDPAGAPGPAALPPGKAVEGNAGDSRLSARREVGW